MQFPDQRILLILIIVLIILQDSLNVNDSCGMPNLPPCPPQIHKPAHEKRLSEIPKTFLDEKRLSEIPKTFLDERPSHSTMQCGPAASTLQMRRPNNINQQIRTHLQWLDGVSVDTSESTPLRDHSMCTSTNPNRRRSSQSPPRQRP